MTKYQKTNPEAFLYKKKNDAISNIVNFRQRHSNLFAPTAVSFHLTSGYPVLDGPEEID
jgi:hypothetical protein